MTRFLRLLKRIGVTLKRLRSRYHTVGRLTIVLPPNHELDIFQSEWKRYDSALGELARHVQQKYPNGTAIDIGANVGDSAALICDSANMPVLCIEGCGDFIPWLKRNVASLARDIVVEDCYVADDQLSVVCSSPRRGTASLTEDLESFGIKTKSLSTIIRSHSRFANAKLLKVDTDGFDFRILVNAVDFLEGAKPVIFFEYYLTHNGGSAREGLETIRCLLGIGYAQFLIYDNFGHPICAVESSYLERFEELNSYLQSNRKYGVAVAYLDVAAFHSEDADLFSSTRRAELNKSE